jgi:hypothetical protein
MSWDVFVYRFPSHCKDQDDIPQDWVPEDIGTVADVRAALYAAIPDITFDADGWGLGQGQGFTVDVAPLGADDEPINGFTLMFRGGGDAPLLAMAIAERLGARAMGSGEFLEPGTTGTALADWHRYRDQTLRRPSSDTGT